MCVSRNKICICVCVREKETETEIERILLKHVMRGLSDNTAVGCLPFTLLIQDRPQIPGVPQARSDF